MTMNQMLPPGLQSSPVHLSQMTPAGERIACIPGLEDLRKMPGHPGYNRSNDTRAVTCLACRRIAGVK